MLRNFQEYIFYKTPLDDCFYSFYSVLSKNSKYFLQKNYGLRIKIAFKILLTCCESSTQPSHIAFIYFWWKELIGSTFNTLCIKQKQLSKGVLQKRCFDKFSKIRRKCVGAGKKNKWYISWQRVTMSDDKWQRVV